MHTFCAIKCTNVTLISAYKCIHTLLMYIMYTYMLQEVNMAGKGSAPRPLPDYDKYSDNWDSIFNKQPEKKEAEKKEDEESE